MRRYFFKDLMYILKSRVPIKRGYPRKKINFPIIIIMSSIFFILMWSISVFETKVKPMVNAMAESRAKVIALRAINEGVREEIVKKISYEDLITLRQDESQRITALQTNMVKMNEMQAQSSYVIQEKISNIGESELKIPIGSLFDSSILAGIGPKITIKIIPFGSVQSEFVDQFVSAGINQTKHKINLQFKSGIIIIMPLSRISTEVVSSIPIAETIIVGNVPNTYLNVADGPNSIENAKGIAENLATQ